jgi:hypothetical protein
MSTILPIARYYPRLSELVNTDSLPEALSFVGTPLESILSKLHYKNFQYSKSRTGDKAHYSLEIVTSKRISIALPFDIALVLNPDFSGGGSNVSAFPISLDYNWEILAYIKQFNIDGFSFTPSRFMN